MANKLYALYGPHASGKTTIIKQLKKMGIHYIPQYTTREPTSISSDPAIYNFIDKLTFFKQDFLIKSTNRGNYYGLLKQDILTSIQQYPVSVCIADASAVKQLSKLIRSNFESIFVMVDYVTLIERMLKLGQTNNEIKQDIEYAENNGEFDNWKFATHIVKNVSTEQKTLNQVLAIMDLMQPLTGEELQKMTMKK